MTEEKQDIESIEEQLKPEPKPKPETYIVKDIISFILLFAIFLVVGFSFFPPISSSSGCEESVPSSLYQSLESAAAIYFAQQRKPPTVFSDFVVSKGVASEPATLSLENIDATVENINTKEMKLIFEPDNEAIYSLNGGEVKASFNFKVEKKPPVLIFIPFIFSLILTMIIFSFLKIFFKNSLFFIILCLFILGIIAGVAVPRFSSLTVTKPAIYLYPKKPTEVNITLDKRINITLDVPKYAANKGWHVMAYPNSKIVDLQPQHTNCNTLDPNQFGLEYAKKACLKNNYPYIYWEGEPDNKTLPLQTKGWLVKTSNIKAFLSTKLDEVGFNKAEKAEFISYWVHKIKESKKETVFISFMQTDVIDKYLPMIVKPTPDSINRFYIIVDLNVNNHKNPETQELIKFKRDEFTLVDWGGCLLE